tara:strand:+ start:90 stop:500 length:411 start_codon:yes stop_codon:yes gene_type:complete
MKLTESQLKQVIAEEIQQMIDEGFFSQMKGKFKGGVSNLKSKAKSMATRGLGKVAGFVDKETGDVLDKRASDIESAGDAKAEAIKIHTVMDSITKELEGDLNALGIQPNADIKTAITKLKKAVKAQALAAGIGTAG